MATTNELIKGLAEIPIELALVPVIGKRAILKNWTNIKLSRDELIKFIQEKKPDGYTIVLGPANNGIVAVDIDGFGCHSEYEKIFGYLPNDDKTTVKVTSGKPGRRCEFYQIPATYWESIESKEIHTGIFDSDGKEENLELRWTGKMQNLPPSTHPDTGKSYQYISSFGESIIAEAPLALIERMLKPSSAVRSGQSRPLTIVSSDYHAIHYPVSIEQIISKECRDLLGGVAEGGRNNIGAKLSRALIGAEESAKRLGINLCDTAEQLFYEFCQRCIPPIPQKEADNIWKNALKDNPTSTLSDEYILNCVAQVKYSQNHLDHSLKAMPLYPHNKVAHQFTEVIDGQRLSITRNLENIRIHPKSASQAIDNTYNELKALTKEILSESRVQAQIAIIANRNGIQQKVAEKIYKEIVAELELQNRESIEDIEIHQRDLEKRLKGLDDFLPGPLKHIAQHCQNLAFDPEVGVMIFYTSVSAMVHSDSQLILIDEMFFNVGPTIYSVLIAPSGAKKTPIQKIICDQPFRSLYKRSKNVYDIAKAKWDLLSEEEKKGQTPPVFRPYIINGGTSEGINALVSKCPGKGILRSYDELASLFNQQGQYSRNGKGDDQQQLLSSSTGGSPIHARKVTKDDSNTIGTPDNSNLPIIGSIQPKTLKKIFDARGGDDADGGFSRFMMVDQPLKPALYKPGMKKPPDIQDYLVWLYDLIDSLPPLKFFLAPDAFERFYKFYNLIEMQKLDHSLPEPIMNQYNKIEGKVGTMIMLLHIVRTLVLETEKYKEELGNNKEALNESIYKLVNNFPTKIDKLTTTLGINWGIYQISRVRCVYAELGNDSLKAIYAKILNKVPKEGIKPSNIKAGIRDLRQVPMTEVHKLLRSLEEMDLGYIQDGLFFKNE
jgi:hypothetical protein